MGVFVDLYKLKVKMFLGALRASKASLILFAFYAVGTTPGAIGMAIALSDPIKEGVDLAVHIDVFSAVISGFLALVLVSTLRGFVVFEYEQGMIFTSTMTPRCFLVAGLLADLTVFSLFFYPAVLFLGVIAASLRLSAITALSAILVLLFFLFFIVFLKSSFSILKSLNPHSPIRGVTIFLVFLLMLPAIGLFASSPVEYSQLPYPSTLFARAILGVLYDRPVSVGSSLGMASYFLASLMMFAFLSEKNIFLFAKPVPLVSPFDASPRVQTLKMGKNIMFFSRIGLRLSLDPESESMLTFLMKKEFIRMVRDGSLFVVMIFYLVISIMGVASRTGEVPFPAWMVVVAAYSFIVPAMLISNWRIGELRNLWIPLTSALNFEFVVKSLLYDLTLIALAVPAVTIVILAFVSPISPLIPLVFVASVSLIGCPVNLYAAISFLGKKRRSTPSFMIGWVSMLLFGLLVSPTYTYVVISLLFDLSPEITLVLAVPVLIYSVLVFWFFSKKSAQKATSIEM